MAGVLLSVVDRVGLDIAIGVVTVRHVTVSVDVAHWRGVEEFECKGFRAGRFIGSPPLPLLDEALLAPEVDEIDCC